MLLGHYDTCIRALSITVAQILGTKVETLEIKGVDFSSWADHLEHLQM